MITTELYPHLSVDRNTKPQRLYAFPLFGFLVKIIILIPVFIELWLLSIVNFILIFLINPFIVLTTGKYWKMAFDLAYGVMRLNTKVSFFLFGVTDKYPGFDTSSTPYTLTISYPEKPNQLYAVPLIGFLIRFVLIIPYAIFSQIISYASGIAVFFSFAPVLFSGKYPETTHEIAVDSIRVSQASSLFILGIFDKYPSFKINWDHKPMKIVLIVLGVLGFLSNFKR